MPDNDRHSQGRRLYLTVFYAGPWDRVNNALYGLDPVTNELRGRELPDGHWRMRLVGRAEKLDHRWRRRYLGRDPHWVWRREYYPWRVHWREIVKQATADK